MENRVRTVARVLAVALVALAATVAAAEAVRWSTVERTYPVQFHPRAFPGRRETATVRNVVLENAHLRIEVAPDLGGRVMHVTYKGGPGEADDAELFNVMDRLMAYSVWDAGGWRVSFPFYEHGMRFRGQTAGWRIVEGDRGAVTLAMEMRFGRFREPAELNYKGRFSHLRLSRAITLRPGQGCFECDLRVENPLPYRVGVRLWTTAQFPLADEAEFLFPVSRMCYHRATRFSDWVDGRGPVLWRNWQRTDSFFSVNLDQPFVGVYYPSADVNRVRVVDPDVAPGAKLYAWAFTGRERQKARFFEIWTGLDRVFEQEGRFLPAFATVGFTERVYLARGIGRVDYANEHVAIGRDCNNLGTVLRVMPVHRLPEGITIEVSPADGEVGPDSGAGATHRPGPIEALTVIEKQTHISGPVRVKIGELVDVVLPLTPPAKDGRHEAAMHERVEPDRDAPARYAVHSEMRGWILPHRQYGSLGTSAVPAARRWVEQRPQGAEAHVTLGRIAYRLGKLDQAKGALETAVGLDGEHGLAHHLLGLTLWEAGQRDGAAQHFAVAVGCKRPHAEAGYFLALVRISAGDPTSATMPLLALEKAKPGRLRPRLLLAATLAKLGRREEAQRLAAALEAADPASVEIAEVAARCFPDDAARRRAVAQLLKRNPEADEALRRLRAEMDRGEWTHPERPEKYEYVGGHGRLEREW